MADDIDKANDCAQQYLDQALHGSTRPALWAVKSCYNCGAGVADFLLFCDRYCRDDYQRRLKQHAK